MYQALYRKYRPQTFDDVVGQEHVTETLKNQINNDRLSHAYLFVGTRGTGKTTCAKIFARAVNCEHPVNGNPCNKCKSCLGIEDGTILDVVELDAASNNGVENVRALRDEAVYSPVAVKKRVYIIDEVHMLSTSAFNALLKILEEPPEHLMFILATTELHKIPATILSRCQRHSFKRIEAEDIAGRLEYVANKENMHLEHDGAMLLSRLANGALRDGLSLLDQCSAEETITAESVAQSMGLAGNIKTAELLNKICDGKTNDAIEIFEDLWRGGKSPTTVLNELCTLLRDSLMIKVAPKNGSYMLSGVFDLKTVSDFSKRLSGEELICYINSIQEKVSVLRDGRDPKISAEICIIGMCEPTFGNSLDFLKARIVKLENAVKNGIVQVRNINSSSAKNAPMQSADKIQEESNCVETTQYKTTREEDSLIGAKNAQKSNEGSSINSAGNAPIYDDRDAPPAFTDADIPSNVKVYDDALPFDAPKEMSSTSNNGSHSVNKDEIPFHDSPKERPNMQQNDSQQNNFEPLACGDDTWCEIVNELKNTIQIGQYRIISDSNVTKGEFVGGELVIKVINEFNRRQLEQQAIKEKIREAVIKVTGGAMPIRIILDTQEDTEIDKSKALNKLNDLAKFDNVKFD